MKFLIDNGHGGVINGVYQTAGKRSQFTDLGPLYEGENVRKIAARVVELCKAAKIDAVLLTPENIDISLDERVRRANAWPAKSTCLISIHHDAFKTESANGYSVFTTPGETRSDKIATVFYDEMKKEFPNGKFRPDNTDGDVDKEENFYIIKRTNCPAILTENFFMTNRADYELLISDAGREKIARAHFNAIKVINNGNY